MLATKEKNRVDPRVRRTRELLRQALQELMTEKSFQSITVQDIAARATVNRATFYAHYADKYALLEDSVRQAFREHLDRALPQRGTYSAAKLEQLIAAVCDFLIEMGAHCPPPHHQYEPLMEKQVKAELSDLLRGWIPVRRSGRTGRGASAELAAGVASWAIYGAAVQWSKRARREPSHDFARQVLPLVLPALGEAAP